MNNVSKHGKTFKIGALLLVVALISTVMISGTFAKYTSKYSGQDTALVAKWSFTGNFDGEPLTGTAINLPIWNHAYETNINEKVGDDFIIAPGIQDQFKVDFTYDADVDANLTFDFVKSGNAANLVPIQYSLDSNFTTVYYSLDALENSIIDTVNNATISGTNGTYTITDTATSGAVTIDKTVYWRWPYDVTDHTGTTQATDFTGTGTDGAWTDDDDVKAGNSSATNNRDGYVLTLTIKAEQIAPDTI